MEKKKFDFETESEGDDFDPLQTMDRTLSNNSSLNEIFTDKKYFASNYNLLVDLMKSQTLGKIQGNKSLVIESEKEFK